MNEQRIIQLLLDFPEKIEQLPASQSKVRALCEKSNEEFISIARSGEKLLTENRILKVAIVGQMNTGKSSFLNSLFFEGENVLPKASTPMTAGLTILEYSDEAYFEIEYYTLEEWGIFKKYARRYEALYELKYSQQYVIDDPCIKTKLREELGDIICIAFDLVNSCTPEALQKMEIGKEKESFSSSDSMQNRLESYVGVQGKYLSVTKILKIGIPDERIKNIQIIDTPGINDPIISREIKTNEFLKECHGVFFLSYVNFFCSAKDMDFFENRISGQGISDVVLLGSKYDTALQGIAGQQNNDLERADRYLHYTLTQQINKALQSIKYTRSVPPFDLVSAISYSIAVKERDKWDDMENHVFKRMAALYPSYFDINDEESCRETFLDLSNILHIKDEYVEKFFQMRKDKIIQGKLNDYFKNNTILIQQELDKIISLIDELKEELNNADLNALEQQKKILNNAKEDLEFYFSEQVFAIKNNIQADIDNKIFYPNFNIPLETSRQTISCSRPGSILGGRQHNFSISIEVVNCYNMREKLKGQTGKLEELTKISKLIIKDRTKELLSEIEKKIKGILKIDKVKDGFFWRRLLEEQTDNINRLSIPREEINQLIEKINKEIETVFGGSDLQISSSIDFTDSDHREDHAETYFVSIVNGRKTAARNKQETLGRYTKTEIDNKRNSFKNTVKSTLNDFSSTFSTQFFGVLDSELEKLENEQKNICVKNKEYDDMKQLILDYKNMFHPQ